MRLRTIALVGALALTMGNALAVPVTGRGTWETTLVARDINGSAVAMGDSRAVFLYDTTLDVTWLRNAFQTGAMMHWGAANSWAGSLTTGGFTDWRLPTVIDTGNSGCQLSYTGGFDCGVKVQTKSGDVMKYEAGQTVYSELAHLFYVTLGNVAAYNPDHTVKPGASGVDWGLVNTADFQDLQNSIYWASTLNTPNPAGLPATFGNDDGLQFVSGTDDTPRYVMVVRSGDVAAPIPEPETYAMLLAGLGLLGVMTRRRKQKLNA